MFDFLTLCRALADENRARILMALRERELCVCQITAFLDLAPSTTSKHLSILRQARLIESAKQGRWVYYRLANSTARGTLLDALGWIQHALAGDPTIADDEARIAAILQLEVESGLAEGDRNCFHSLEMHSLAHRFETAEASEHTVDTESDTATPMKDKRVMVPPVRTQTRSKTCGEVS